MKILYYIVAIYRLALLRLNDIRIFCYYIWFKRRGTRQHNWQWPTDTHMNGQYVERRAARWKVKRSTFTQNQTRAKYLLNRSSSLPLNTNTRTNDYQWWWNATRTANRDNKKRTSKTRRQSQKPTSRQRVPILHNLSPLQKVPIRNQPNSLQNNHPHNKTTHHNWSPI